MRKLKALLFDIDGTLVDTDHLHLPVFQEVLKPFGYHVDEAFFKKYITGRFNPEIFRELLPASYSDDEVAEFGHKKEAVFREYASSKLTPLPGLTALLAEARSAALPCFCVTNAPKLNAEFMLREIAVTPHISRIVLGEECPRPKPFPDPYVAAMQVAGVSVDECVVFEDSPSGVRSAKAAGAKVIVGLLTTQTAEALLAEGATVTFRDYTQISLQLLDDLLQR